MIFQLSLSSKIFIVGLSYLTLFYVGGTLPPRVISAGVQDIQLHTVKKLLFIKFTEQQLKAKIDIRIQAGLVWPLFDITDLVLHGQAFREDQDVVDEPRDNTG